MIDISKVELRTNRLILRPWKISDLNDFFEYGSVDGVGQMAGWLPHQNIGESERILNKLIANKRSFAIEHSGKVIGSFGIKKYNEKRFPEFSNTRCRELSFVLSKKYWGQGLMQEAIIEVANYLFKEVKLDIILCNNYINNKQSSRLQRKCGFSHYSFGKAKTQFDTIEDDEVNILTHDQWINQISK